MKQLNAVVAFFASLSLIFNSQHLVAANTNQDKQSQVIGQANTLFRGLGTYQNLIKYLKPRVESIDQKTLADIEKTLRPNEKLPTIESKGNEVRFSNFKAPTLVEDFKNSIFSLNGKKWQDVFPSDGLFDRKSAAFRFKTDSLKPGTYVLVLKVKDAAGNVGSGDVVFNVQAKP